MGMEFEGDIPFRGCFKKGTNFLEGMIQFAFSFSFAGQDILFFNHRKRCA
jgi:hypothetical protein